MEFNLLNVSLIGLIVIPITLFVVIKIEKHKKEIGGIKVKGNNNILQNGETNTITNIGTINFQEEKIDTNKTTKTELTIEEIKSRIKVLFVDDKEFPIVDHLKSIGYVGTDYMPDIDDIDDTRVRYAHIIFLDINGVGIRLGFKNQGMGLCGAIKDKYGNSKRVILYSAETLGSLFDPDAKKADDTIPKDSDYVQFTTMITDYAKELL